MEHIIENDQRKGSGTINTISYDNGEFIIREELLQLNGEYPMDKLPGVLCKGIQYYDLKNVGFINNTGMAGLIDLLKSLLKQGVETKFVNVNEQIKVKIRALGLDRILNCV